MERRIGKENVRALHYQRLIAYLPFAHATEELDVADMLATIYDGREPGSAIALREGTLPIGLQEISQQIVAAAAQPPEEEEEEEEDLLADAMPGDPAEEYRLMYPVFDKGQIVFRDYLAGWWFGIYLLRRVSASEKEILLDALKKRYPNGKETVKAEAIAAEKTLEPEPGLLTAADFEEDSK